MKKVYHVFGFPMLSQTPSAPVDNFLMIYPKTDGFFYSLGPDGKERCVGAVVNIPYRIVDITYYENNSIRSLKYFLEADKFLEFRFKYYLSGSLEGKIDYSECKDDADDAWVRITYKYDNGLLQETVQENINSWTI